MCDGTASTGIGDHLASSTVLFRCSMGDFMPMSSIDAPRSRLIRLTAGPSSPVAVV